MKRIILSNQADEDLFDIWHFIAIENANPENAGKFIDELDELFQTIVEQPFIGVLKDEYFKDIRQVVFRGYLIFYFPTSHGIEIIRVLNGVKDIYKEMKRGLEWK